MNADAAGELVDSDVPIHIAGTAVGVPLVLLLTLPDAVDVLAPLQRVVVTSRQVCQGPVEQRRSGLELQKIVLVQVDPCPVVPVLESDVPAVRAIGVGVDVVVAEGVPASDFADHLDVHPDVRAARELIGRQVPVAVLEELVAVRVGGVAAEYVLAVGVELDVVVRAVVQRAHVPEHRRGAARERGVLVYRGPRAVRSEVGVQRRAELGIALCAVARPAGVDLLVAHQVPTIGSIHIELQVDVHSAHEAPNRRQVVMGDVVVGAGEPSFRAEDVEIAVVVCLQLAVVL